MILSQVIRIFGAHATTFLVYSVNQITANLHAARLYNLQANFLPINITITYCMI